MAKLVIEGNASTLEIIKKRFRTLKGIKMNLVQEKVEESTEKDESEKTKPVVKKKTTKKKSKVTPKKK